MNILLTRCRYTGSAVLALVMLLAGGAAHAQQVVCELDASTDVNVDFGTQLLNVVPRDATSATGFNLSCSNNGQSARNVKVCVGLGPGSGGAMNNVRYMTNADNIIHYNLYPEPSRVSGTYVSLMDNQLEANGHVAANTTAQITMPGRLYGRANIQSARPLTYSSTFSGADVNITYQDYDPGESEPACAGVSTPLPYPGSFTISMNVPSTCILNSATSLDFGARSSLLGNLSGNAAFIILCAIGVEYTVSVNDGLHDEGSGLRHMRRGSTPHRIRYEIYKNAIRSQRFGSTGNERLVDTMIGRDKSIRFYGHVFAQPIPSVGTYTDTLVVTVEY